MSHFGYMQAISKFEELGKQVDDMQRYLDILNGDGSWMGVSSTIHPIYHIFVDLMHEQTPFQAETQIAIHQVKVNYKYATILNQC